MSEILYKYLGEKGGLMMLQNSNLQFTNATKFNDPFDCHPALFDYSNLPIEPNNWPPADFVTKMEENRMENLRNSIWISCFSKVYDQLLMWAYYNSHKGVCVGLDKEAVLKSCQYKFFGQMSPFFEDVTYKDILKKPDYFKDRPSWIDLLTTKAKEWEHEHEVRLITKNPSWVYSGQDIPNEFDEEEIIDGKEIRHYPLLTIDCFESIYLGVNMLPRKKAKFIKAAKELNPEIKIYQMTIDPDAFRLKAELIND